MLIREACDEVAWNRLTSTRWKPGLRMGPARSRSMSGPWWLLVLLAFGVVAMHHLPFAHPGAASLPHVPPAISAMHDDSPVEADHPMSSTHETATPAPLASAGDDPSRGHGLPHLCLAILAAAAAVLTTPVMQVTTVPEAAPSPTSVHTGIGRVRPPLPGPRRLAVLCVFRL